MMRLISNSLPQAYDRPTTGLRQAYDMPTTYLPQAYDSDSENPRHTATGLRQATAGLRQATAGYGTTGARSTRVGNDMSFACIELTRVEAGLTCVE